MLLSGMVYREVGIIHMVQIKTEDMQKTKAIDKENQMEIEVV
jgi:hypothetical protein